MPQINPAVVQSLRGGIYMNIIGGAFSQCALLQLVPWMWRTDVRQIRGPASLRNTDIRTRAAALLQTASSARGLRSLCCECSADAHLASTQDHRPQQAAAEPDEPADDDDASPGGARLAQPSSLWNVLAVECVNVGDVSRQLSCSCRTLTCTARLHAMLPSELDCAHTAPQHSSSPELTAGRRSSCDPPVS